MATIADRNTGAAFHKDGSFSGTEVITLTFTDGSGTFRIDARFCASAGSGAIPLHALDTRKRRINKYAESQ